MCGIAGIVGPHAQAECLDIVGRMNRAIAHRGPDDEGCWAEDGFGFGMRRLSIIDLSGGHQPMWSQENRLGVVFNGEIYNYQRLRNRIGADRFRTTSDTEVVLRTLDQTGVEAVHEWNGMFAVAAWYPRERKLLLLRDRMGVKPLYYFWNGTDFLFASEMKALLASGLVERRVNRQAIWDYLTYRYVPSPQTAWEGIRKLPPGHALEFDGTNEPILRQFWRTDVISGADAERRSEASVEREFTDLFLDAVQLRLIASDVPVGVLLSGGLDSSAVAAAAVELGHQNFHTFSVGFDDPDYSELHYARQLATHVGARHHEVVLDQKAFLDALPEVSIAADEPLADLASVPLLAVSKLARQDVKVVLSGEGSDEILAGYDLEVAEKRWRQVRSIQRWPRPFIQTAAGFAGVFQHRAGTALSRIANLPLSSWNRVDLPHMTQLLDQEQKKRLWPAWTGGDSKATLRALYDEAVSGDPLQQLLSVYQRSWLVEDLLMKADKMSMATSLELRTPFLDYRLVQWANQQANWVKISRNGGSQLQSKYVLRRFCASRIPGTILTRPKRGFPVPAYRWLTQGLGTWAHDKLLGRSSRLAAIFDAAATKSQIDAAVSGDSKAAHNVWLLLVLEIWLESWGAELS
jgi:asparagine synthase (glutamine-hydrolysing)